MSTLHGRILVTGGAGFIGSALVWALNQRGVTDITVVDFLDPAARWQGTVPLTHHAPEKQKNLRALKFATYVEADVFRARLVADANAFGKFSAVFHLGANSATTEKNAAYLRDINFDYTRQLAAWALAQGARFIYASSAATYGDGSAGMDDKDDNLTRLHPLNLYGQSKQDFDVFAQREGWLPRIVGVKYFNVFGPNEDHKGDMRSLVNKAFQQIRATGRVQLFKSHKPEFKDGEQMRDFLSSHLEDLRALLIVSQLRLVDKQEIVNPYQSEEIKGLIVGVDKAPGIKCERCWIYAPSVGSDKEHPAVCDRCLTNL